jgi:signal transduction histidine kinase/putative methionine-R-sulfoxide reductase with GAF domain
VAATRPAILDTWHDRLTIAVSLTAGILIGWVATRSSRRAHPAEDADLTGDEAAGTGHVATLVRRLADEQRSLRRVATLVAEEAPPPEVFALIVEELGGLLGADEARMGRYDEEGGATIVAGWGAFRDSLPVGTRIELDGQTVLARVLETERPARIDDFSSATGTVGGILRAGGLQSAAGAPIVVDGRLWGAMVVGSKAPGPLPADTEARVQAFCELAATAISNSEARRDVRRLADEQAGLRRVATLVAEECPPSAVFGKVAEELATLLGIERTMMVRYEPDATASVVADWNTLGSPGVPAGTRLPLEGESLTALVFRTGRPARMDDYMSAVGPIAELAREHHAMGGVGCPISVNGRLWGVLIAIAHEAEPLPPETESRMGQFTELVATAIGNAEARAEARRLTDEQAALRRIATLVAEGSPPPVVFDAVTAEAAELLRADQIALTRFEPGPEITVLAHRGRNAALAPVGTRLPLRGESVNAIVHRTGRAARLDSFEHAEGSIMQHVPDVRTGIGTPIVVDGRLWGTITGGWLGSEPAPPDAEQRLTEFAELLAVAIANADSRAQLTASRARMLAAGDDARRRVVRDLHDGAQQRLVQTIVTLKLAARALDEGDAEARELVAEALEHASRGNAELRELALGILPAVLTRGGLRAGVGALVTRLDLPVAVDLPPDRFAPAVEASAYFVVAEALTNVVKHAQAKQATVRAHVGHGMLRIEISDDGVGGADVTGDGLIGIGDRVSALGGELQVESPRGAGTVVTATLPLSA